MNAIKYLLTTVFAAAALSTIAAAGGSAWMTDIDSALAKGKKEGKPVMVEFTGLAWCGPCQMMEKAVFSKKSFTDAASKDYILVQIDVPMKKSALRKKNAPLMKKYRVNGVPTVILFGEDGKEFDRFSAGEFPNMDSFLGKLARSLERKDMD